MARFEGKSIIVTGAASGIGRAAARLFAEEGGKVFLADWSESVLEAAEEIKAAGGTATGRKVDVGVEAETQAMVAAAKAAHGDLHIIFANAGVGGGRDSVLEGSADLWAETLRVNLIGPAMAIKHGAPLIQDSGGGAIVCTASVAGINSGAGSAHYSASKAGVMSLVKTAAQQLTGAGVRVNAVCPGIIETGMTKPVFDYAREKGKLDRVGRLNPLQRYGAPEEVARVALFLASEDASYLNGQSIAVDGGLSSSHPVTRQVYGQVAV
ncbi:SDR family NAD(P)-dependent oxidoreductase [Pacificimonas flava]|uniref:3-oxoacyl-[acyl-carrier protein] reductase n=1 Tax=Pacificimonas flava TaxID=1234595 RepID=M2U445_9SPHN|nr:SDR family oxidoreductase [Pacificimonas flava]EMD82748.1 3-oxoacyl-[acyl-carrier protein] reductase [Pacificimonas flava]MBB5279367.1 NAD(P)-dependent dehydrogenase (short-subunit alcohol dehydrogenase family) [Pacificimonas flava]